MTDILDGIRGIIFDCDGTLTDSMPVHYKSWSKTFADHGIPFDQQRFYALAGMPSDRIIDLIGSEHGKQLDAPVVAREKEENFLEFLHEVAPVERVVLLAREQKSHRKLAVASGGFRWVIERQLAHLGFAPEYFDAIVTAEDTERHKPHPDVFLEAARRLQLEPSECLVFEDAELGIEAARRAGMAFVDVRTGDWGSSSI
jgi:beta-phosphoglucomutase family hydrolase